MTNEPIHLLPWEQTIPKILEKRHEPTSPKYGLAPDKRSIKELIHYGIINIDKPAGPTSHQVSAYVKQILGIKKTGHSGTLDPKVTGVLPVALGKGTRAVQALLPAGKEYVALMHLHAPVERNRLEAIAKRFTGTIRQLPPVKSAVKRQERNRTIYYLDILDTQDQDVLFIVGCQAGTYIRKLIHDMGEALGVHAHMVELRRTKAGPFNEQTLVTLQDLKDAMIYFQEKQDEKELRSCIQPIEAAVQHLPKIWVLDTAVDSICHGASLKMPGVSRIEDNVKEKSVVAILSLKEELIALGEARSPADVILKSDKGVAAKPLQVFMQPGTYPTVEKK